MNRPGERENEMSNTNSETSEMEQDNSEGGAGSGGNSRSPETPVTIERVADTALGALVSIAEAVDKTIKLLNEHGPAIAEAWETKGRPVRERIVEGLRGAPFANTTVDSPSAPSMTPETTTTAGEEISALERRVRELEQQIASGDILFETPSDSGETPDTSEETTAESATFNGEVWEAPEERDSLSDSPFAISETSEQQKKEFEEQDDATPSSGNDAGRQAD